MIGVESQVSPVLYFIRQSLEICGDDDMHIRAANRKDVEQLRHLYFELETDGVKYQPEHFIIGHRSDDFFNAIFESDHQDILVADVDETIVGFSHVMILKQKNISCLKPQTAVYIQDIAVLENERNKGIGTLLIKASKEYGKKRGADFIRTQVFPQNMDGIRFYERNGFCEMMKTMESQL
ncbi:MAG: GNAT family N-acetyltransferase [Provencibacterium sp.]|nr:GNAT family N-acetyltransferase [Provencibacterium sp.]